MSVSCCLKNRLTRFVVAAAMKPETAPTNTVISCPFMFISLSWVMAAKILINCVWCIFAIFSYEFIRLCCYF